MTHFFKLTVALCVLLLLGTGPIAYHSYQLNKAKVKQEDFEYIEKIITSGKARQFMVNDNIHYVNIEKYINKKYIKPSEIEASKRCLPSGDSENIEDIEICAEYFYFKKSMYQIDNYQFTVKCLPELARGRYLAFVNCNERFNPTTYYQFIKSSLKE